MKNVKDILDVLEKKVKQKMFVYKMMWSAKPDKNIPPRYTTRHEVEHLLDNNSKLNRTDHEL